MIKDYLKEQPKKWIRIQNLQELIKIKYKIKIAQHSIVGLVNKVIKDKDFIIFPKKRDDEYPTERWVSYRGEFEKANKRCGVCYTEIEHIFHIIEDSQDIIRAECPNSDCQAYLGIKHFNKNLIPLEITACQSCNEQKPIYFVCPECGLYLCKKCIIYHKKILHQQPNIPEDVKCARCNSIYIELQCIICDKWYCKNCFPKNREYTDFWFKEELIDNPLPLEASTIKEFLDQICIQCIGFTFNCENCEDKGDIEKCKICIKKSRIQLFKLVQKYLHKSLEH
ncbi:MAG: hypothetical protein ACTSPQ_12010 [Candidatus Helarchaeota archaeon]